VNRVLFVDDEPAVLDSLRRLLRPNRSRWQMEFAGSGPAALDLLAVSPVDVIVTDFRMPGMNGGQLLAIVRERCPEAARLILSGYSGQDKLLSSTGLVHQYLNKPCSLEDLEAAIENAFARTPPDSSVGLV
jgi:YesN/AraC family two-component response regulator